MRFGITGGTGFVGGHLAIDLARHGHDVIVVARGIDDRPLAQAVRNEPGVTVVRAGLDDIDALAEAFEGTQGVAHCAGINREIGRQTYDAVHVRGTANVVRAAERAGVRRLVITSFLRARSDSGSPYHDSKWAAEEILRASSLDWTVLKLGVTYGAGDHLLTHLSHALTTFPVFLGVGQRRVRPLAVEDAVRALSAVVVDGRLSHQTVPLLGPTEVAFDEATRLVGSAMGRKVRIVRVPLLAHRVVARLTELTMREPLIAVAQVRILSEEGLEPSGATDNVPDDLQPVTEFGVASISRGLPAARRYSLSDLRRPAWLPGRAHRSTGPAEITVCGKGRALIQRDPADIFEFVLDVAQYRKADHKIGRLHFMKRDGDSGTVRHGGRLMGIPAPAATLAFQLEPTGRLDFRGVALPWPLRGFKGHFQCDPTPSGTMVTHLECFTFNRRAGLVFRAVLGSWLVRDTQAEVLRMKTLLEGGATVT